MDNSSQLTIAYYMLYYVKLAALSIKTICRTLTLFVFQIAISSPECNTWHKFPNPGGAISTKNVIFPIQGAQF